jgi:ubiquitin thioesterase OTU1
VLLIFNGVHYDAAGCAPTADAAFEFDTTMFPAHDTAVLSALTELASVMQKENRFTDLARFKLRCEVCDKGIKGQHEAAGMFKCNFSISFQKKNVDSKNTTTALI